MFSLSFGFEACFHHGGYADVFFSVFSGGTRVVSNIDRDRKTV